MEWTEFGGAGINRGSLYDSAIRARWFTRLRIPSNARPTSNVASAKRTPAHSGLCRQTASDTLLKVCTRFIPSALIRLRARVHSSMDTPSSSSRGPATETRCPKH